MVPKPSRRAMHHAFDVRVLARLIDVVPGSSVGRAFGC